MASSHKADFSADMFNGEDEEDKQLWLVTFADAMSLLLTFFVLLISFSSFEEASVVQSMQSMSEHLGGGIKEGMEHIRSSFRMSDEEDELSKNYIGLRLADSPVKFGLNDKPISSDLSDFKKVHAMQELLKDNPALLNILIQKKGLPPVKKNDTAAKTKEPKDMQIPDASVELSLQNLQHYVVAEGVDDKVSIQKKDNGKISFEFDCSAVFDEDTATMIYQSKQLLMRIAKMIKTIPNKIAVQPYVAQELTYADEFTSQWKLPLARAQAVIDYILDSEPTIDADRISVLAQGCTPEKWESIQKANTSGEGVLEITVLPFNESSYL